MRAGWNKVGFSVDFFFFLTLRCLVNTHCAAGMAGNSCHNARAVLCQGSLIIEAWAVGNIFCFLFCSCAMENVYLFMYVIFIYIHAYSTVLVLYFTCGGRVTEIRWLKHRRWLWQWCWFSLILASILHKQSQVQKCATGKA